MSNGEHLSGYQRRDYEVVDYNMFELGATGLHFRGPARDLASGGYFSCIGAAQTFGCLVQRPFPQLLADELGLPALNLGYGGAGPEFFARQQSLDDYINGGAFVVVQIMSGRSQSNSHFYSGGLEYLERRQDGAKLGSHEAYRDVLAGPTWLRSMPPQAVTRKVAKLVAFPTVRNLVNETREAWVESYRTLLARYTVPKILVWFSRRSPRYFERYWDVSGLLGEFPHLVQPWMVDAVAKHCDAYVECVTSRGSPEPLISRFTGGPATADPARDRPDLASKPWVDNHYYPSTGMHLDVAAALLPVCRRHL